MTGRDSVAAVETAQYQIGFSTSVPVHRAIAKNGLPRGGAEWGYHGPSVQERMVMSAVGGVRFDRVGSFWILLSGNLGLSLCLVMILH